MGKLLTWWLHLRLESTVVLGATVLLGLIALCAVFVHFEEGWGWVDSFYFAIVSITTVGYGDWSLAKRRRGSSSSSTCPSASASR